MPNLVSEERVMPNQTFADLFRVRIQQQLVFVESKTFGWVVRSVNPISVKQARASLGQVAMPDLVRLFGQRNAMGFPAPRIVEKAQLHLLGVLRKQGEVHSFAIPGGSEWIWLTGPDDCRSMFGQFALFYN